MTKRSFALKVDGQSADPRRLECQFQSHPYPGGHRYELIIADGETVRHAREVFGAGTHRSLGHNQCRTFLSFLGGMKTIKIGRENPPQFWVNTIDEVELSEDTLVLKGVCSHHVSA
jgi:hypothetical protein